MWGEDPGRAGCTVTAHAVHTFPVEQRGAVYIAVDACWQIQLVLEPRVWRQGLAGQGAGAGLGAGCRD